MTNAAVPKHAREAGVAMIMAVMFAACRAPVLAEEKPASPEDLALGPAAEAMREADGLGQWTRGVIGRALKRAGEAASGTAGNVDSGSLPDGDLGAVPLPAERHGPALAAGRPNTPEILIFMSLAVPAASWRQWARDAARTGAPIVLRGVGEGGLRAAAERLGERLGDARAGVAIDPRLFRLFGIARAPAVAAVPGGVPPCRSRGCSDDPAPPHDLVTGNIGLAAALEAIAAEGGAARGVARRHLERLEGLR